MNIGAISTVFLEAGINAGKILKESAKTSVIREVTHNDVTSKHFADWFFKMADWADIKQKDFPFDMITHSDEACVYGYFNNDRLDAIIKAEENDDSYELSFFFVNRAIQLRGIGQLIFQYVLNKFKNKKLILYVYKDNNPAIHIYQKYGFKNVGVGFGRGYRPKSPHYIMQRDIPG